MKNKILPLEDNSEVLPPVTELQSLEEALGISALRFNDISFIIDEIYAGSKTKEEVIRKIAKVPATEEERVFMGFLLARKMLSIQLPFGVRGYVLSAL